MTSPLHSFLAPNSIAVIGASKTPTKRGYQAIARLLSDRFSGPIYPINPREPEILGLRAYPSVLDVDGEIDLALICTAAKTLPDVLAQCGKKGVKGAVILAGGLAETGAEGRTIEQNILHVARENGIRLVGPNTNGIFNLHKRMNLIGASDAEPGAIAIVSQSGNFILGLIAEAKRRGGVGFSAAIGVGNQTDIRFSEYLEFLGEEENTAAAILYVEGFKNDRRFLDVARRVTQNKPVVVYKSGRTEAGQKSTSSHTGALAGSYRLTHDVLRQAGVTVVEESDKILCVAEALAALPTAKGKRVAIITDSGGHASIAADALVEAGLVLADVSEETRDKLIPFIPAAAQSANPLDIAAGMEAKPHLFADGAEILLQDANVDLLLIIGLVGGYSMRFSATMAASECEASVRLGALIDRFRKPIIAQSVYAPLKPEPLTILREAGMAVVIWVETAVQCAVALVEYGLAKQRIADAARPEPAPTNAAAKKIVAKAVEARRSSLFEYEAKELLKAHGVDVPPQLVLRSPDDLGAVPQAFGDEPVAMKIVSKDILHKSDAGGVELDVRGDRALRAAYRELLDNAKAYKPDAEIEGVLVSPMAEPGVEVIIGVVQDPVFGPVMMFGLGGIFVEVLKDVVFRSIPMGRADAEEMLDEIQSRKILTGVRGKGPRDRNALVDLMMKVSALIQAHPEIAEVDLNPVVAYEDGYAIVDARVILRDR